jgi:hypothetical protein
MISRFLRVSGPRGASPWLVSGVSVWLFLGCILQHAGPATDEGSSAPGEGGESDATVQSEPDADATTTAESSGCASGEDCHEAADGGTDATLSATSRGGPIVDGGSDGDDEPNGRGDEHDGGGDAAPCMVHALEFSADSGPAGGSCSGTICTVTAQGLVMSYCIDFIDDAGHLGWGGCRLGRDPEILSFDTDEPDGGQGVLEVRICTVGSPASGALNLWYGDYPERRRLALFADGVWANGQTVQSEPCVTLDYLPTEAIYATATEADAQVYPPPACPLANRCGSGGTVCLPDGSLTPTLTLIGEWSPDATQGQVRLEWIRHYATTCQCKNDNECADGSSCVVHANEGGCADPQSPGVCAECVGAGTPCQIIADNRQCDASLVCVAGRLSCPCSL